MLRQIDLCSGIGAGFPLAGKFTGGFDLYRLCEIDDFAKDILSKRFPGVPIFSDIRTTEWDCNADVVTASPPCQPFSIAGKRLGAADERDCLPFVFRAIATIRPRFVAIENVPGLLHCPYMPGYPKGSYFQLIKGAFRELGYNCLLYTSDAADD